MKTLKKQGKRNQGKENITAYYVNLKNLEVIWWFVMCSGHASAIQPLWCQIFWRASFEWISKVFCLTVFFQISTSVTRIRALNIFVPLVMILLCMLPGSYLKTKSLMAFCLAHLPLGQLISFKNFKNIVQYNSIKFFSFSVWKNATWWQHKEIPPKMHQNTIEIIIR